MTKKKRTNKNTHVNHSCLLALRLYKRAVNPHRYYSRRFAHLSVSHPIWENFEFVSIARRQRDASCVTAVWTTKAENVADRQIECNFFFFDFRFTVFTHFQSHYTKMKIELV